jgi:hypothetical protein
MLKYLNGILGNGLISAQQIQAHKKEILCTADEYQDVRFYRNPVFVPIHRLVKQQPYFLVYQESETPYLFVAEHRRGTFVSEDFAFDEHDSCVLEQLAHGFDRNTLRQVEKAESGDWHARYGLSLNGGVVARLIIKHELDETKLAATIGCSKVFVRRGHELSLDKLLREAYNHSVGKEF